MNTILSDENVAKTSDVKSEVSLSNLSDLISIKIEAILPNMRNPNQRPAGATSQEAEARPKMRNQDHGKVEDGEPNTTWKKKGATRQRPAGATSTGDGELLPGAEKNGGDDATEAGGGNLHRGRGATAWGREDGGDDAT